MPSRRWLLVALFLCAGVILFVGFRFYMSTVVGSTSGAHLDHRPRHGGTFFMSVDGVHHLEGVLVSQGTFQVYVYDAFTRPCSPDDMKETSGVLEVGETANPEKIPMKLSQNEKTLDAEIGKDTSFPITLTLYLHLPGSAPDAKPELFTFHFNRYSIVSN